MRKPRSVHKTLLTASYDLSAVTAGYMYLQRDLVIKPLGDRPVACELRARWAYPDDPINTEKTMLALTAFTSSYLAGAPAAGAQRADVRMAVVREILHLETHSNSARRPLRCHIAASTLRRKFITAES